MHFGYGKTGFVFCPSCIVLDPVLTQEAFHRLASHFSPLHLLLLLSHWKSSLLRQVWVNACKKRGLLPLNVFTWESYQEGGYSGKINTDAATYNG